MKEEEAGVKPEPKARNGYKPLTSCEEIRHFTDNRKSHFTERRIKEIRDHLPQCVSCVSWMLREVLTALTTKRTKAQVVGLQKARENLMALRKRLGDDSPISPRVVLEGEAEIDYAVRREHRVAVMW